MISFSVGLACAHHYLADIPPNGFKCLQLGLVHTFSHAFYGPTRFGLEILADYFGRPLLRPQVGTYLMKYTTRPLADFVLRFFGSLI